MKHLLLLSVMLCFSFKFNETQNLQKNTHLESVSKKANETTQVLKTVLYQGTLNGTTNISLYIHEQEHPCGGNLTMINAMYKYDNQDRWILLEVTTDKEKKNYCMVEDNFTGVLFLEEKDHFLNGNWISPNTQKQFKVTLKNQLLDTKYADDHTKVEKLDEILFDELIYGKNDC